MKFAQCAVFVSVIDSGSFTGAARRLGLTQSAVSHAVARLEQELGGALLTRGRGGVALTELGRRVAADARAVVRHAESMRRKALGGGPDPDERLRFGTSQSFAARLLPALLSALEAGTASGSSPALAIREGTDGQIAAWLEGGALDLGVVALPKPRLDVVPLLEDELLALVPDAHPLAGRERVALAELARIALVLPVGGVEPMVRAGLHGVGATPAVAYRSHDINALLAMAAAGLGVGVLPSLAVPAATPGVVVRALDPPLVRRIGLGIGGRGATEPAVTRIVGVVHDLVGVGRWRHTPADAPLAAAC